MITNHKFKNYLRKTFAAALAFTTLQIDISTAEEAGRNDGVMTAEVHLSFSSENVQKAWSSSSSTPRVDVTEDVPLKKEVTAFVVFEDCSIDSSGACSADVEFFLTAPSGKKSLLSKGSLAHGKPSKGMLMLGTTAVTLLFEERSDIGKNTIEAIITDKNSKKKLKTFRQFIVVTN